MSHRPARRARQSEERGGCRCGEGPRGGGACCAQGGRGVGAWAGAGAGHGSAVRPARQLTVAPQVGMIIKCPEEPKSQGREVTAGGEGPRCDGARRACGRGRGHGRGRGTRVRRDIHERAAQTPTNRRTPSRPGVVRVGVAGKGTHLNMLRAPMEPARSVRPMAREGGEGPGQGKAAREGRRFVVSHCTCISRFWIFSPDFRPGHLQIKS